MFNVVRLDADTCIRLMEAASRADVQGVSLRVHTGTDAHGSYIKWDVGNTGWTPPYYGVSL